MLIFMETSLNGFETSHSALGFEPLAVIWTIITLGSLVGMIPTQGMMMGSDAMNVTAHRYHPSA